MAKRTYEFDVLAKLDDAISSVDSFASKTQKQLDGLNFNTGISAIKDGFDLVTDAAKIAINAIQNFGSKAIEEALSAEKAQEELANSLRLTGDFSQQAAKDFEDLSKEIASTTAFSDDATIASAALAKQFRLTNKETEQAIKVAADLAAVQGTSLEEATRKVAQTFNGFVDKSLAKVIPGLKNLTKEALVAGEGMALIGQRVHGSAEALGNNFSGAAFRAGEAANDIFETFGKFVTQNPAIIAGINEIAKGFREFQATIEKNGSSIQQLVTDGFLFLVESVPLVIKGLEAMDNTFATLSASAKSFIILFTGLPTAILQGVTGSTEALDELKNRLVKIDDAVKSSERSRTLYEPLIKSANELIKRVRIAAEEATKLNKVVANAGPSTTGNGARLEDLFSPEDIKKKVADAAKEPIRFAFEAVVKGQSISAKESVAIGAGLVSNVLKGAKGAEEIVKNVIGGIADTLLPGIGGVVGEIVGVLAQGPEQVKKQVEEFARAIPVIIENIVKALPVLIETLARELPPALAKTMPLVAVTLTLELVKNIPKIIEGFIKGLIDAAGEFVDALIEAITGPAGDAFDKISGKGSGGAFEGIPILGGIGDLLGFAEGGRIPDVPQFQGDGFGPVMMDGGEQIFNRDLSSQLERFLNENQGRGVVNQGTIVLQIGLEEFARVSYEADRRGFRMQVANG